MSSIAYHSYKNLPQIAGICSLAEAAKPGLSVNDCVDRLKRYHYAFHRLWLLFNARLTAEPVYEIKMAFSLHAHLCAEHVTTLRERVSEMRHPPLGLDKIPHDGLRLFFDEIQAAPQTYDLLQGIYGKALPALKKGLENHLRDTNRLADWPSVRQLRFALLELEEMFSWGRLALSSLAQEPRSEDLEGWLKVLDHCLASAGGLDGTEAVLETKVAPRFSVQPWVYDRTPRRDERFPDPYNMGVHAEEFLYDPENPASVKTLMMYYKRIREIDVPEMMASILVESKDKPWEFHRDMTRQLWDEARHAMMGETGFVKLGIDWPKNVMVNFTWSKGLNEQLTPQERHAVLWYIEQGLMTKTGKRYEWEVGKDSGDSLAELFQDYDWADEVLHARIGRDWYVSGFENNVEKAAHYGNECWSKVLMGWEEWKNAGLTEHRNWWPDLYHAYCQAQGLTADEKLLTYSKTYAVSRADLKRLAASG